MANGIEETITTLYEMVQDAWSLPLGAEKCVVERDKVLDLLDEIRRRPLLSRATRSLPMPSARRKTSSSRQNSAPSR